MLCNSCTVTSNVDRILQAGPNFNIQMENCEIVIQQIVNYGYYYQQSDLIVLIALGE